MSGWRIGRGMLAAGALATAVFVALMGREGTDATHGGAPQTVDRVYITMEKNSDPVSPPGSVTPFSSRVTCASVPVGGKVQIDVIMDQIHPDSPMGGYEYRLRFDPSAVTMSSNNKMMIAQNPGGTVIDFSQPSSNDPAVYMVVVADFRYPDTNYIHGTGVLTRFELTGVAAGLSDLTLESENMEFVDGLTGEGYGPAATIGNAQIAVGVACPVGGTNPTATPAPTPTPTPTSTPTPTPTAAAGATPTPTAAAGATPTPTAGAGATPSPTAAAGATPTPTPGAGATPTPTPGPGGSPSPAASPGPGPTATPDPEAKLVQGDVDCNQVVEAIDALLVLRKVSGQAHQAGCMDAAGDLNCDGVVDTVDALGILRYVAELPPIGAPPGCARAGELLN